MLERISRSCRLILPLSRVRSESHLAERLLSELVRWVARFTSISAGDSHLLVLTSNHRAFAAPINLLANSHGQLGVRQSNLFTLPSPSTAAMIPTKLVTMVPDPTINDTRGDYQPPAKLDPLLSPTGRGRVPEPVQGYKVDSRPRVVSVGSIPSIPAAAWGMAQLDSNPDVERELEREIRFCTVLHEIPALRGLKVVEMVAGSEHSIARTGEGRVLGWGSNSYGQLGTSILDLTALDTDSIS